MRAILGASRCDNQAPVWPSFFTDPLKDSDVQGLAQAYEKKLGKRVEFQVSVDPGLLAGLKVTVNGVTYDGTLRSQLDRLKENLSSHTGT